MNGVYHIDLELPTLVLMSTTGRIESRSDERSTLFRMTWRSEADDIFPGDRKLAFNVPYFMDDKLFRRREEFFGLPVRATLYHNGRRGVVVEQAFEELEVF